MIVQAENPVLEVHDLTVSYNRKPVLWDVDFSVAKGSLIGILGPNGSGKTTLIKSIMNLVTPSSGYIKLYNESLENVRDKVCYIPQRETVDWDFPASVMDIALMGRYQKKGLFKRISVDDRKIAAEALEKVGMLGFAKRQISQLSGGQQQRVFIARALAQEADFYMMDEPFTGVDASTETAIVELLSAMRAEGKTIMVVHHDIQSAYEYFDWFVFLNTRLVAAGPKEDVFTTDILQETYGGKLTVLSKIGNLLREKDLPIRES